MKADIFFITILALLMITLESTKKSITTKVEAMALKAHRDVSEISSICTICVGAIADYNNHADFSSYKNGKNQIKKVEIFFDVLNLFVVRSISFKEHLCVALFII